jgi:hypothetical protein
MCEIKNNPARNKNLSSLIICRCHMASKVFYIIGDEDYQS